MFSLLVRILNWRGGYFQQVFFLKFFLACIFSLHEIVQVVELSESQRYAAEAFSRPGTQMGFAPGVGGPGGGGMYSRPPSRPPSGFGGARFNSTPSHGGGGGGGVSMAAAAERAAATRSASGIPRLPPLARGMSVSVGAMPQVSTFTSFLSIFVLRNFFSQVSDPREERIEEMERLVVSYQVRKQSKV